jgi:CBS domain-containing protein
MIVLVLFLANTTEVIVRDIMEETVSITADAAIGEMLEILKKEKVVMIPVVDKNNVLVGAVTEYDMIKLVKHDSPSPLAGAVWLTNIDKSQKNIPVREKMSLIILGVGLASKALDVSIYSIMIVIFLIVDIISPFITTMVFRDGYENPYTKKSFKLTSKRFGR